MVDQVRSRVSAYGLVTRQEHLLLTRLSEASPVFRPGLWHLPGGGVDPGEQPQETLARELHEETGLEVLGSRLVDARGYTAHRLGVRWHLVALFYRVDVGPGTPTVTETGGSTAEVRWMPRSGLTRSTLSPAAVDGLGMLGR
ncbi:NUDIX domain-containing protein [Streptomyces sp. NBC_00247]|uniref:NUDIX hydrolase n=1 Tax=Streptomyces sp. NBC_00247 TaxID=2975689 RepID=UPI002E2CC7C0|nr:NUDIX domain-containing protein [Streptomyces sp. NBC_00247]